ncbi:MAG: flagellar basal body rod protein FlgB [Acidobacteria bacterium]|nr:flagellar basal body rod protein FlgB [Acidobacteriota bacterium]
MNEISDDAIMKALGRQMNLAVAKQVVTTGNLANLDTPGYRTREIDFEQVLAREVGKATLAGTSGAHSTGTTGERVAVKEVDGLQSRRDGNNVQLDRELLEMTRASGDFSKAQTALAAKFRLIRYAINEGR